MKILAINFPSYHKMEINDRWWGEGFTEWDNVKKSQSLFPNHNQPRIPLNGYYNMATKTTIKSQCELAKKYGLHGFIYYHYWFDNNNKELYKPIEILRDNPEIDINYSLCWANETWKTTWHNQELKVMKLQKYGLEDFWKNQLEYLLTFFKDNRYIKRDNKPMYYIYNASDIPYYDQMVIFFDNYCKKNGFSGIYIVEFISSKNRKLSSNFSSAVYEFEPLYTTYFDLSFFKKIKRILSKILKYTDYQDYIYISNKILRRKRKYKNKPIIKGYFSGWDNSPRKQKKAMILKNEDDSIFHLYLNSIIKSKRINQDNEFFIINAWNEWSEGAYLEPDTKNKYKYLESIRSVVKDL